MSKYKLDEIVLNKAGVRELLRSAEMMALVESEANKRAAGLGAGYSVNIYTGRNRVNAEIRAETFQARRDNLKNNTLLRAIS